MITPKDFVERWAQSSLREQQGAQSHFNELCELVNHKTPTQLDPAGEFFTFEEQVEKATGGRGRADVWYRGHFAWEYKGRHKDLDAAYAQLLAYRGGLDNPPLLVVCDFLEYRIYPQWPNMSGQPFVFRNEDLLNRDAQNFIRWLLESPERFQELRQADLREREQLTRQLAEKFAHLADLMREVQGEDGQPAWDSMRIARFLTRLVFSLFAEDVDLLPSFSGAGVYRAVLAEAEFLEDLPQVFRELFEAMDGQRRSFFARAVPYFNGGLFADSSPGAGDGTETLDLSRVPGGLDMLLEASDADWRKVDPTIFGTLFEGALDKSKRAQLGAHFTSEEDIRLIVEPALMEPLNQAWDEVRAEAEPLMQTFLQAETPRSQQTARERLIALHDAMMHRLENTRVLDPACGSGNFLYVSLRAMKDLEARVRKFFDPLGLPFRDVVTPRQLFGIEKDPFAAKLAHVVAWIGYLQWRYEDEGVLHPVYPHKIPHPRALPHPIIQDKNHPDEPDRVICADAIMRFADAPAAALPSLRSGEGSGVGTKFAQTRTTAELWPRIKLLARELCKDLTPAEDALWQRLRGKQIRGYRFRRQHPIDRFVVDFFCPELRLVVEVDGPVHDQQAEYDDLRQAFIESLGIRVLRFTNDAVLGDMEAVLVRIEEAMQSPPPGPLSHRDASQPAAQGGGESAALVSIPYEPDWPEVDVIVSNPPFLGDKRMRGEMGDVYVDQLRGLYEGRVPGQADLVTYWFEKARAHIAEGRAKRAGMLATNSIRQSVNQRVLERIKETGDIFMAWSDRPWVLEGAAVRVSMVGFDDGKHHLKKLNGISVDSINADLTATVDITIAAHLEENIEISFQGPSPKGDFDIDVLVAQKMLEATNPSGRGNHEVVKRVLNAADIVRIGRGYWTIDFGPHMPLDEAMLYELPFAHVKQHVFTFRQKNNRDAYREKWWIYAEARVGMREALRKIERYIATPRVAKHRVFVWVRSDVMCNDAVIIFARDDDYFFGVLHSTLHEVWSLRMGTWLGKGNDPRYTPTTTFETFPFPWPPGREDTAHPAYKAIAAAAQQLHAERDAWLNPASDLLEGPARDAMLRQLTLTNLYNALVEYREHGGPRNGKALTPAQVFAPRLHELHTALDQAVCDAYEWPYEVLNDEEDLLRRLLALNLERAKES